MTIGAIIVLTLQVNSKVAENVVPGGLGEVISHVKEGLWLAQHPNVTGDGNLLYNYVDTAAIAGDVGFSPPAHDVLFA